MRYAPRSLTHREKLTALVLADDANDDTRVTWHSTEDPEVMRMAMVPDERAMRRVIAKLREAKVIEHAGGGHNGKVAKFRCLPLGPASVKPGESDPATTGVGGRKSPANTEDPKVMPDGKDPATTPVAGSSGASSRVESATPTPQTPQEPSSPLDPVTALVRRAAVVPAGDDETTFIGWMKNKYPDRGIGWWRTIEARGDLAQHAADWKHERDAASPPREPLPPHCGTCGWDTADNPAVRNPTFRRLDGGNGPKCPDCHPDNQEG